MLVAVDGAPAGVVAVADTVKAGLGRGRSRPCDGWGSRS